MMDWGAISLLSVILWTVSFGMARVYEPRVVARPFTL